MVDNNNRAKPRKVKTTNPDAKSSVQRRNVLDLLPGVLNSDLNKKFFAGTVNHLFQPESTERISAFIGEKPPYINPKTDFYIEEPSDQRSIHQLESTMVSRDTSGNILNGLFYDDLVNQLRFQGGITENESRLFSTEYYSWCPPVNIDMLMNYTNYYWYPSGPDIIRISDPTDVAGLIGSSETPITLGGVDLVDGDKILLLKDINFLYRDRIFVVSGVGSSFQLTLDAELFQYLWDDLNVGWDMGPWDGPDPRLVISLDEPDYIVMQRGARDGNAWSVRNRWYHRDELDVSQLSTALEHQAKRPIIEFIRNLELYNHGTFGRAPVTVRDDVTTDPDIQIVGKMTDINPTPIIIDGIQIANGDTILFTNRPTLQGTWDIEGWDLEDAPDGIWDQFFNINYSAPINDIITTIQAVTNFGQFNTLAGNFISLGFKVGMKISVNGTIAQNGTYTIGSVTSNTITVTEPFTNITGIGMPQPYNVTIVEQRTVYQNRVFKVSGIGTTTGIQLTIVADGQNADGSPADGDQIKVLYGLIHATNEYYWSDDDNLWLLAQQKKTINQPPLFQMYDSVGVQLQDVGKYPLSNFEGNKIFSFQINSDTRQPYDDILNMRLVFNNFGEITFQNHIVTDRYAFNFPLEPIIGFYYHRLVGDTVSQDVFGNDWYMVDWETRQKCIENFVVPNDDTNTFELKITPNNGYENVTVFINHKEKTDKNWIMNGKIIEFIEFFEPKDIITVQYYSNETPDSDNKPVYEIPLNLEANPDNDEVQFISNSDWFAHFSEIIKNQTGLIGNPNGSNNWRDTIQDRSLGNQILQHRAPMLKLMALASNHDIDFMVSTRYNEREYSRFKHKFVRKINEFNNDNSHPFLNDTTRWINDALDQINLGKTDDFPFYYSGMGLRNDNKPTFIPSTPSRLGSYQVYKPEKFTDKTYITPQLMLQCHDGSLMPAYNDFRDDVLLALEQNIYDNIPDSYKGEVELDFDWFELNPGKFRSTEYSRDEFNQLLTPMVQRWAISNSFDLGKNDLYSPDDPFTWNYSSQNVPGYWRGIYRYFYDTDRPNTHPWEMLGFSEMPSWWTNRYGLPPYTSADTLLWDDLRLGRIAHGTRQGIDVRFQRINMIVPVNDLGNLKNPLELGISQPGLIDAIAPWKIGDCGPVETVFRRSEYWPFAVAQVSYLMKPAKFIELNWDGNKTIYRYEEQKDKQWTNTDFEDRPLNKELFIHGQTLDDKSIYTSNGIQQWVSDYIKSNGKDVNTVFSETIRGLGVNLAHKMAGFVDGNVTKALADNFGLVPQEDLNISLYTSPSIKEEAYSGVIVERVEKGWKIYGYDVLDPVFHILPSIKTSSVIAIDIGKIRVLEYTSYEKDTIEVPYGTTFGTQQELYDFLISYGKWLEYRGWIFDQFDLTINENKDWRLAGKQFVFWSQGNWQIGSLITLSPAAQQIKFTTSHGSVQSIEQIINGVYSLLDRDGRVIQPEQTFVTRYQNDLVVIPNESQAIYSARMFIAEYEHALIFNNKTIFNDLIYNPLYNLKQPRFKLSTARCRDWVGRYDAPGYVILDNGIIANYEKSANDFRRFFEVEEGVEKQSLRDTARHLIGFQTRDYLTGLRFSDDTQFEFYQGFIKEKGTQLGFEKLLRSEFSTQSENLKFLEEWALKVGEFGATDNYITSELILSENDYRSAPQIIEFRGSMLATALGENSTTMTLQSAVDFPASGVVKIDDEIIGYTSKSSTTLNGLIRGQKNTLPVIHNVGSKVSINDSPFDDIITIGLNDPRWYRLPPNDGRVRFPFRPFNVAKRGKNANYYYREDLPTSGYPLESEVSYRVQTIEDRNILINELIETGSIDYGATLWVDNIGFTYPINDPNNLTDDDSKSIFNFGFMVYRYSKLFNNNEFTIAKNSKNKINPLIVSVTDEHGLKNNDLIIINGSKSNNNSNQNLNGSFVVSNIDIPFTGDGVNELFSTNTILYPSDTTVSINGVDLVPVQDYEINGGTLIVSGTANAKYVRGQSIIINGTTVTLSSPAVPSEITGPTNPAAYTLNSSISINSFPVTLSSGTTVAAAVSSINSANVPGITASNISNALKLANSTVNGDIILYNTASIVGSNAPVLGGGSTGTLTITINATPYNVPLVAADTASVIIGKIQAANIPNFSATLFGGAIRLMELTGLNFALSSSPSSILSDIGMTATTYVPSTTLTTLFGVSWTPGSIPATVDSAIKDINASITNGNLSSDITATKSTTGQLVITNTIGESLELANGIASTALTNLGITPNTYVTSGSNIRFLSAPLANDSIILHRDKHFDITDNAIELTSVDLSDATIGQFTESRFKTTSDRNNAKDTRGNNIPWISGENTWVDDGSSIGSIKLWTVETFNGSIWNIRINDGISRIQNEKIDSDLVSQSVLYNKDTNLTDLYLNIWDPAKGLFPLELMSEIKYKLEYDPAKYTNGDETQTQIDEDASWGDDHVGEVWWDISTVEYENYEIGSNRERRNKWGRLAPGKSIDVYEWVRSIVPPSQWAQYVEQNEDKPESSFRYKPSGEAYRVGEIEDSPYSIRMVYNNVTELEEPVYYFWVKYSTTLPNIPSRRISVDRLARGIENPTLAGLPWFAPINDNSIIISGVEPFLTESDSILQLNYDFIKTENNVHREWKLSREGDPKDKPLDQFWNKMRDSLVGFDVNYDPVPDPKLEQSRRYGNMIRPRQTWFIDRHEAIKIFLQGLNAQIEHINLLDDRPTALTHLFSVPAEPVLYTGSLPHIDGANRPVNEYDFHVSTIQERDDLILVPGLHINDQIWVDGQTNTFGFWTVYRYKGLNSITSKPIFELVYYQTYRVEDFWNYIDYYSEGYSASTRIDQTVETLSQRNVIIDPFVGMVVKVNDTFNNDTNIWTLYVYDGTDQFNPWILIGKKLNTIQFNVDLVLDQNYGIFNSSTTNIDPLTDVKGNDQVMKIIVDAVRTDISIDLEQNLLFYIMIHYVLSEQTLVDWVFKTSYILGTSLTKTAAQDPVLTDDPVDFLIEFLTESKPYHTKLRDFVVNANFGRDTVVAEVIDFDKPVYYDPVLEEYRTLDDTDSGDRSIMARSDSQQYDWFNNYQINPGLIRKNKTTILFDRISCEAGSGWDSQFGWDYGINEDWDVVALEFLNGAADRIIKYYQPQPFSAIDFVNNEVDPISNISENKNIRSLIAGCNFRGSMVDGGKHLIDINDIDTYINGGAMPNGGPLNPSDIIVDGNLFIQPYFESDHPEELTLAKIGESISIIVTTDQTIGSSRISNRVYFGVNNGPFDIGQTPASDEALFVYINGIRAIDQTDYTVDRDNDTITFVKASGPIPPNVPLAGDSLTYSDVINIISFSGSGGDSILSTDNFIGNGIISDFTLSETPPSNDSVFVTKDGKILDLGIDYTISGDTLHMIVVPALNSDISASVFLSNGFTKITTEQYTVSGPIVAPASNTFDIGQIVVPGRMPTSATSIDNLVVSVNGTRQIPYNISLPNEKYDYKVDYNTSKIIFVVNSIGKTSPTVVNGQQFLINGITVTFTANTINNAVSQINAAAIPNIIANLSLEGNAVLITNTIGGSITFAEGTGGLAGLGFPVGTISTNLQINDIITVSSLTNDYGIIKLTYATGNDIININQDIIVDEQIELYINGVLKTRNVDYTVDILNNDVIFQPILINSLVDGDEIKVLIYYTSTQKYVGSVTGEYTLLQSINPYLYKTLVYVNGIKANLYFDYDVQSDFVIKFKTPQTQNDQVVITQFVSRESVPAITFRLFLDNVASLASQDIESFVQTKLVSPLLNSSNPNDNLNFASKFASLTGFPLNGLLAIISPQGTHNEIEFIKYNNLFQTSVTATTDAINPGGQTIIINGTTITLNLVGPNFAQQAAVAITQANISGISAISIGSKVKILSLTGGAIQLAEGNGNALSDIGFTPGTYYPEVYRGYNGTPVNSHSIGETVLVMDESELADWKAYRISDAGSTTLAQPLASTDTEITLTSVAGLPKQPGAESFMKIPGVIWIGAERIEYFHRDGTVLKQIRRGTGGTSAGVPAVYGIDGILISDVNTGNDLVYPIGTKVIDGSNKQLVPGGYEWQPSPFGLQYSNNVFSKFLLDKPGTY